MPLDTGCASSTASNARRYDLVLQPAPDTGTAFVQIGSAGGLALLARPGRRPRRLDRQQPGLRPAADGCRGLSGRGGDLAIFTDLQHPIHVHLDPFQVVARNGKDPGVLDVGWKDTVSLLPGEFVDVAVRFADYPGA